jgi:ABC-type Fe3+ transport system permease subunit
MSPFNWDYWSELGTGFVDAILLLVTGDGDTWAIIRQSLFISITATLASIIPGVPIGAWIAVASFPGRNLLMSAFNTGFGLPPVVVGLVLSILPVARLARAFRCFDRGMAIFACGGAIARWWCRCRLPITLPACQWAIGGQVAVGVKRRLSQPSGPCRPV